MKKITQLLAIAALAGSFYARAEVVNVESSESFNEMLGGGGPFVVKYYADWCGACRSIEAVYKGLSDAGDLQDAGVIFAKVNVDKVRNIEGQQPVPALPTFRYYLDGEQKKQVIGAARNFDESVRIILQAELGIEGAAPRKMEAPVVEPEPPKVVEKEPAPAAPKAPAAPAAPEVAGGIGDQIINIITSILKLIQDMINAIINAITGLFGGQ